MNSPHCFPAIYHRQVFLATLGRALLTFGTPTHCIDSQIQGAAKILEIDAYGFYLPGINVYTFRDKVTKAIDAHWMKSGGRMSLGALHEVHQVARAVTRDEISAKRGIELLEEILKAPLIYGLKTRCLLSFLLAALICPFAFGGSFVDMWFAGLGGLGLCLMQHWAATQSPIYSTVFQ